MSFANAIEPYYMAGWRGIIPVPPGTKHPPPSDPKHNISYTGASGIDTDPAVLAQWAVTHGDWSTALRIPRGMIALDVDHYDKGVAVKRGGHVLADLTTKLGALPSTWASTARGTNLGVGPSRTLFYRCPDQRYRTKLPDIEILQFHHRYCVVAPSHNPDFHGAPYRWYGPDGTPADRYPKVDEFPELPAAWVAYLAEGAAGASPAMAAYSAGDALLAQVLADDRPPCREVDSAAAAAVADFLGADPGGRHDMATGRTYQLITLGALGHPGAGPVLELLGSMWTALTPGEDREGEFERMLLTAARKAVTAVGMPVQVPTDPCEMGATHKYDGFAGLHQQNAQPTQASPPAAVPPEDAPGELPGELSEEVSEAHDSTRPWSVREFIGSHAFTPHGAADQTLAHQAWERMWPGLRYAFDAGEWLVRIPDRWELRNGSMHKWAASTLGDLMPTGDPTAEKGSDAQMAAVRRAKFITNGSAGSIAEKMQVLVTAGDHPCSLELARLDSDPEIMWAGGVPWDLRASATAPSVAHIDPATPHLRSAAVAPVLRPTPLWDDFLATVWPDAEIRAWALRVLAIGATGYPDAALPILLGDTGRGKTQVIELLLDVLGSYGLAASPKLLGNTDNAHASIVIALMGRRFAFIDEGPRNGHSATEQLKQLTGGGRLTGNRMRGNPVEFRPTHTLVLTTNEPPSVTDPAVRRRVRLIPCDGDPNAVYSARAAITPAVWAAERPGVLAMLMAEAGRWLDDRRSGLTAAAPLSIRYAAEELADQQNLVKAWIDAEMVPDQWGTKTAELLNMHGAWRRVAGAGVISLTKFGRDLNDLGYPSTHREDGNYRGLRHKFVPPGFPSPVDPNSTNAALDKINNHLMQEAKANSADAASSGGFQPHVPGMGVLPPPQTRKTVDHGNSHEGLGGPNPSPVSLANENVFDQSNTISPAASVLSAPAEHTVNGSGQSLDQPFMGSDQSVRSNTEQLKGLVGPIQNQPTTIEVHTTNGVSAVTHPIYPGENGGNCSSVQTEINNGESKKPGKSSPDKIAKAEAKAAERAAAKIAKAAEAVLRRAAAKTAKIAAAAGPTVALPALVGRGQPPGTVSLSVAIERVRTAVARDSNCLTVDIESNGYPVGHRLHKLRTVQLGDLIEAVVFDPADPAQAEAIRALLIEAPRLRAFSATADLAPLAYAGLGDHESMWARMEDVIIAAKLADPAGSSSDAGDGLKASEAKILRGDAVSPAADAARKALFAAGGWLTNVDSETEPGRNGWAQVPSDCATMATYAASDVLATSALAMALPDPGPELWARERAVQRMTARISLAGARIDGEHARTLLARHVSEQTEAAEHIRRFGIDNPGSGQQVAARLVEMGARLPRTAPSTKFPTGQLSAANDALIPLRNAPGELGELVAHLLEFNSHKNAISTFLKPYVSLCDNGDGRARPTIYTMEADTGRMSCVRPNFQNIPREGGFRKVILADPGMLLISADFSGVELRVAAALSQDQHLLNIILADDAAKALDPKAKSDIHWKIAQAAYGPQATKPQRYNVKRGVFGKIYGSGIPGIARTLGITQAEAAMIVELLDDMTPGLMGWDRQLRNAVKAGNTHFKAYSGRVIHLDQRMPHKAGNYCIQGTGRELIVDGLLRWSQTKWGNRVLFPVHDEICVFVPEAEAEEATATLVDCMATTYMGVPILAAPSAPSTYWADAA